MKWYMSPSWYRNSISVSSRMARSTMSTERNRWSLMEPLLRFRIFACTMPRRLPGVLCCASTTQYRSLSCLMHIPRFSWVAWIMPLVLSRFYANCAL